MLGPKIFVRDQTLRRAPLAVSDFCCWCFRWIALALVVILRCVWPLWDFLFRSYEHFEIIICLETIIVTLIRPYWLSIQDMSINEIIFCQKSNKKSNLTFPTLSDFIRLLDFFRLLEFQTQQPYFQPNNGCGAIFGEQYLNEILWVVIPWQHSLPQKKITMNKYCLKIILNM